MAVAFDEKMLWAVTPQQFPVSDSFLPMIVQPSGPTLKTRIMIWTSLVVGPRTKFDLLVLKRKFPSIPYEIFDRVGDFIKDDNVLILTVRKKISDRVGQLAFHINDPLIGSFNFAALVIPTNSWLMMNDIYNDLLAVGAPYNRDRMNQFVMDVMEIMNARNCIPCLHLVGNPRRRVLVIAPEKIHY
jgi:hypothetical protein